MIFGLQGPGTGPMSAELTLEELNRIECANAPEEDAPPPVLGDQAVRSVFQEIARVCSQHGTRDRQAGPCAAEHGACEPGHVC